MKDHSTVNFFKVGDPVNVVDNVMKAGINLKGWSGIVIETWEKCEVDPTCCCAEWVDEGMAVHVRFEDKDGIFSKATNQNNADSLFVTNFFVHYFAEEELVGMKEEVINESSSDNVEGSSSEGSVAFDGLSCTEFKLNQIMTDKPRGIASFEPRTIEE